MDVTIKFVSLLSGLAEEGFLLHGEMTDFFEDYRSFLGLSP